MKEGGVTLLVGFWWGRERREGARGGAAGYEGWHGSLLSTDLEAEAVKVVELHGHVPATTVGNM